MNGSRNAGRWMARLALAAVVIATCLVLAGVLLAPTALGPDAVTALALIAAGGGLGLLWATLGERALGFAGVYALYLIIAHLGLVGAVLLSGEHALADYAPSHLFWLDADLRPASVAMAGLAVGAFCLAAACVASTARRRSLEPLTMKTGSAGVYAVGMMLLVASALYMVVASGGDLLPIFAGYSEFRYAMELLPGYSWMLFALATGITFALSTGNRRQCIAALLVFGVPGLALLMSGNRGEVFYPAAAAIAILARRGVRPTWRGAFAGLVAFFLVIPLLRQVRGGGLENIQGNQVALGWTDPFVEIGFTLRPLVETVQWRREGEESAAGATYLLPLTRIATLAKPGSERPDIEGSRFYIDGRLAGQGYSVVAEAFFNFGIAGVVVILGGLGVFLALYGDRARSLRGLALTGAIMAVLVNNIRNVFMFVPGHIIAILMLFGIGVFIDRLIALRRRNRSGVPAVALSGHGPARYAS